MIYSFTMGVVGIVVFFLFNGVLLVRNGQTIEKRALGIRIVDSYGAVPTFEDHLLPRYATYLVAPLVPVIG